MLRSYVHALLALVVALSCLTDISLARAPKTSLKLLGQWSPPGVSPGTEQVAYDDVEKVAYLIGGKDIYVIDLSQKALLEDGEAAATPRDLPRLKNLTQPTTVNDVAFCGDYLAVSANGATKVLPGSVTIFRRYRKDEDGDEASDSLEQLAKFTVGALPDQLAFSVDCKTILTSNEGEPEDYNPASLAKDPEGSVSVINLRFCEDEHHHRRAYESHDGPGYAMGSEGKEGSTVGDKGQTESTEEAQYGRKSGHHEHYPSSGHHGPHGHKKHHYVDESDDVPVPECDGEPIAGVVRTARFDAWNDKSGALTAMGIKLDGINATVAQDLEPECTAFSHDESIAFVSLQDNNAVAVLDVRKAVIRSIHGLGFKDHSFAPNALDASDKDGPGDGPAAILKNWPLFGMYQPDEVKAYSYKGEDYFVAANEGDARDYDGLREDQRRVGSEQVKNKLDPSVFPNAATLANDANMGRLRVLTVNGAPYQPFSDPNKTGNFSKLFSFGARSFTIWKLKQGRHHKPSDDALELVFDSGSQLEQTSKDEIFDLYNSQLGNVDNSTFDIRSPAKGPEPEGLIIAPCAGGDYEARPYYGDYDRAQHRREYDPETEYGDEKEPRICLYLGTERTSVVFVYDITNPYKPVFQSVARPPRASTAAAFGPAAGRRLSGPEGLTYAKYHMRGGRSLSLVLVAYEADAPDVKYPGGLGVYAVTDLA